MTTKEAVKDIIKLFLTLWVIVLVVEVLRFILKN